MKATQKVATMLNGAGEHQNRSQFMIEPISSLSQPIMTTHQQNHQNSIPIINNGIDDTLTFITGIK